MANMEDDGMAVVMKVGKRIAIQGQLRKRVTI